MGILKVSVIFTVILFTTAAVGGIILKGHAALQEQFPYHAYIGVFNSTSSRIGDCTDCSGAVLTSKFVISTFDCVWEGVMFRVKLGSLWPRSSTDLPAYDEITQNLPYHYPTHSFDQRYPALLKMQIEISFSHRVAAIPLPKAYISSSDVESVPSANYKAIATGYGYIDSGIDEEINNSTTIRLEFLKMLVDPISECRGHFAENLLRTPLCVRTEDTFGNERGSLCQEVSAPLVSVDDWTLIGMFGITDKNCTSGGPNLFIKIDRFVDWIEDTIKTFGEEKVESSTSQT